jgi:hypothetical protein
MTVTQEYNQYQISDTFQNIPVEGVLLISNNGVKHISLYLKNTQDPENPIINANYNEDTNYMINVSGDPTKVVAFAQYFSSVIPTILSSTD